MTVDAVETDERSVSVSGPYFSGQVSAECGHYYPDVLRLRDEKRPDGSIVRISDCRYCGRSELVLEAHSLDKGLIRRLNKTGVDVGIREEDLAKVRQTALKRIILSEELNGFTLVERAGWAAQCAQRTGSSPRYLIRLSSSFADPDPL